ncbi:MAG: TetR family transcriptional regulator [Pseudomonadota bacterium]
MSRSDATKSALVHNARLLFWAKGFSNVSLRQIATAAGVDVALISRYFGSKVGLFQATMTELPVFDLENLPNPDAFVEIMVENFATAEREDPTPSPVTFLLANMNDDEVGDMVRADFQANWHGPLTSLMGDASKASQFTAALLGFSIAEKSLKLDGIAHHQSDAYKEQLRSFLSGSFD